MTLSCLNAGPILTKFCADTDGTLETVIYYKRGRGRAKRKRNPLYVTRFSLFILLVDFMNSISIFQYQGRDLFIKITPISNRKY